MGFDYPAVELGGVVIAPQVLALVSEAIAHEKQILPLGLEEGVLRVAVAKPSPEMVENLRFLLNHPIAMAAAPKEALAAAIQRFYPTGDDEVEEKPEVVPTRRRWVDPEDPGSAFEKMLAPDDEAVARMVQAILRDAFQLGASRVLILPYKDRVKVACRIEGAVCTRDDLAPEMLYAILCTLMTMTDLSGTYQGDHSEARALGAFEVSLDNLRRGGVDRHRTEHVGEPVESTAGVEAWVSVRGTSGSGDSASCAEPGSGGRGSQESCDSAGV